MNRTIGEKTTIKRETMTKVNFIFLICVFLQILSCDRAVIDLGQPMVTNRIDPNAQQVLLPYGSLVPMIDTTINKVKYTIGLIDGKIAYISSEDENLKEVDVFRNVGLSDLKKLTDQQEEKIRGWGYYLSLGNGWYAGYSIYEKLDVDRKPDFFFKYKFPNKREGELKIIPWPKDEDK